ncbi:hypothetical protein PVAP13_9NG350542 [Panicum virgatum]|uniref:Uncharacterized protein n=1 Tax=Panicum virgatum TaxID=38727 RepID=A0A8T0MUN1_PANVG|nr:hypothetical protein PVAP13_9NG350542 [Panicum virgatum]
MSDTNIFAENAAIEKTIPLDSKGEQNKAITSLKKDKSNKKTYTGWGSEELMRLLSSSGKDTSKSLDEDEIVGVIMAYIKKKNLFKNNKKKSFLCDEKLHLLFGRRKVGCKSIRKFLAVHLAANSVSEDEIFYGSKDDDVPIMKKKPRVDGSEDDDDDGLIMKKKPRNSIDLKIVKRFSERNKRCFASLNENNIKLIYLRRYVVIDLLNHPDTFDQKVVGCFVRVKNAPIVHKYEMPKNPYQLGLVTGIKKSSEEYKMKDTCTNILLCVTGLWDDVKISMLSDEDFTQEECNDLVSSVKNGLLEKPTIAALEEKVATVHKDIVNHWIDKEVVRLERAIERANRKGWKQEFEELMQQLELLSTESERMRRLEEVPEIIADTEQDGNETELEVEASNSSQQNIDKEKDNASYFMAATENSKGSTNTLLPPLSPGAKQEVANSVHDHQEEPPKVENVLEGLRCLRIFKEKLTEVTQGTSSSNDLQVQPTKDAAEDVVESLRVHKQKPTKDARGQGTDLSSIPIEESLEDGSTGTMEIEKDETKHSRCKNSGGANFEEAIYLDSDRDEDLHIVEHRTEATRHVLGGL